MPALKGDQPALAGGGRRLTLINALVVAQVAVSLVLLVATGLFVKSVGGARTIDPGFRIQDRVVMSFNTRLQRYDRERATSFYRRLMDAVRALPTVESATLARYVPLDFEMQDGDVLVEGRVADPDQQSVQVMYSTVDDRYFSTLGTPLVRGRAFTARDTADSRRVAVVNETMAKRLWPGQDPVGKRFRFAETGRPWIEVVGVAADGKTDSSPSRRGRTSSCPTRRTSACPGRSSSTCATRATSPTRWPPSAARRRRSTRPCPSST